MSGLDLRTLMMLLRRGAAFTDSRRTVSESWPPPGRMTPLRRPRDVLGGMQSGAPSPSPYPSRSDMSTRRRTWFWKHQQREINELVGSDSNKVSLGSVLMPFKGERVLAFLGHQPLSSSVTLEKTNQPNFVNYEQTVIVTELTSGSECELVSSVHLRSTEGLTVEIRASHAGRLPSVWTWMRTGLVRSPDARNKSSPLPVSLVLEAGKAQFERENPSKPRCVTRTNDSEVVSMRKQFENNPAVSTGLPETLLLLPKTHRCQSAERSELALLSASREA